MLTPMGASQETLPTLCGLIHVRNSSWILFLHLETRSSDFWKSPPVHWVQVAAQLQEGGEQVPAPGHLGLQGLNRATEQEHGAV